MSAAFCPDLDGTRVVTASGNKTARVWDVLPDTGTLADWSRVAERSPFVTVIKKTFLQKGNGQKEEALLHGLGAVADAKTAERILKLLGTEKILTRISGDEGSVYVPIRSHTQRMRTMLAELALSKDPLWTTVAKMDKKS